jgi:hypothetical protein
MTDLVRWDTGAVIHSGDDLRSTVEAAAKLGISCFRADLRDADLRDADLRDADLRDADLTDADLRDADLTDADLRAADLTGANLTGADLPIYCRWSVTYTIAPDLLVNIGCKTKSVADWDAWFAGSDEYETLRDTEDFKRIRANYLAVRAYLVAMELVK